MATKPKSVPAVPAPAGAPPVPAVAAAPAAPPTVPSVGAAPAIPQVPFSIVVGAAPPERTRTFGGGGAEPSPYVAFMKSMPAPTGDAYASFFIPAETAPATITDATEREKFTKDKNRKTTNNIGAISRRIKKGDKSYNFTTRELTENGVLGVRVWRVAPVIEAAPATA